MSPTSRSPAVSWGADGTGLAERLAVHRGVREQIERSIPSLATSVDGVEFTFRASLHRLILRRGGYVLLESDDRSRLGQITELGAHREAVATDGITDAGSTVRIELARGSGLLLHTDGRPFHDVAVRPADRGTVGSWLAATRSARAGLTVGELLLVPGAPVSLDSGGLGRHTFLCGQSGSGKTYALGLLLEQVLAETGIRVVILDPNSDHVGLSRIRADAAPERVKRYAGVPEQVSVWGDQPPADRRLRIRFADLDPATQAAVLGLDPIRDREEYAALTELLRRREDGRPLVTGLEQLLEAEDPGTRGLGLRAGNLGLLDWRVWDAGLPSLVDELRSPTSRCTVVDLGSLDTVREQRLVAEATLSTLWQSRSARRPCLIVVDEAHNVCPAAPSDEVSILSTERTVQIAAEGRKYGLYLLVSTQRPHSVHPTVVSQCDNLLLMRMNSRADLAEFGSTFSFVPRGLVEGASAFRLGEALVAGRLSPLPAYVRLGERVSEEGGGDVPASWAYPGLPDDPA